MDKNIPPWDGEMGAPGLRQGPLLAGVRWNLGKKDLGPFFYQELKTRRSDFLFYIYIVALFFSLPWRADSVLQPRCLSLSQREGARGNLIFAI